MDPAVLNRFCANELYRHDVRRPWIANGFAWATNLHIAARMPSTEQDTPPSEDGSFPDFRETWAKQWREPEHALPALTGITAMETIPCYCQFQCPVCEGLGEHVCDECETEHECGRCNGKGYVGKKDCPDCHGRGSRKTEVPVPQPIGSAWIAGRYAKLLHELPGKVLVSLPSAPEEYVSFRCGELEGLVAPVRLSEQSAKLFTPTHKGGEGGSDDDVDAREGSADSQ